MKAMLTVISDKSSIYSRFYSLLHSLMFIWGMNARDNLTSVLGTEVGI